MITLKPLVKGEEHFCFTKERLSKIFLGGIDEIFLEDYLSLSFRYKDYEKDYYPFNPYENTQVELYDAEYDGPLDSIFPRLAYSQSSLRLTLSHVVLFCENYPGYLYGKTTFFFFLSMNGLPRRDDIAMVKDTGYGKLSISSPIKVEKWRKAWAQYGLPSFPNPRFVVPKLPKDMILVKT